MKKEKKQKSIGTNLPLYFSQLNLSNQQNLITAGISLVLVFVLGFSIFNYFSSVNKEAKQNVGENSTQSSETVKGENKAAKDTTSKPETYTVKEGDTLWNIAENVYKDGFRWTEISQANGLTDPNTIHVGNVLTIPQGQVSGTSTVAEGVPTSSAGTGGGSYIAREGDSVWSIAEHYYGSGFEWYRIDQVNKFDKLPNGRPLIRPGQRITIP
ncbi:MAG: LysM peptidoglycan-binding domain-containing protein [Patescibacteria group bacterium]|nr:LysM peptidoglycan-binding domain-containing protein [Patescibacteria group bacterium]